MKLFRTIEDLYEELVVQGIIVRTPQVRLSDYEGEYSYLGTTLRQANIEPMPSLSDVRRLVTEFAILPLGTVTGYKESQTQVSHIDIIYLELQIMIKSRLFFSLSTSP